MRFITRLVDNITVITYLPIQQCLLMSEELGAASIAAVALSAYIVLIVLILFIKHLTRVGNNMWYLGYLN